MAANELDAVGQLPAKDRANAFLDVVDGQRLDALSPDGDPLEQRSALVVARLAYGEDGVEVDVRLDQRRRHKRPAEVDDLARLGLGLGDDPVAHADVPRFGLAGQARPAKEQVKHSERSLDQALPPHRREANS